MKTKIFLALALMCCLIFAFSLGVTALPMEKCPVTGGSHEIVDKGGTDFVLVCVLCGEILYPLW